MTWLESLDDPVAGPFGSARVSRVDGRIQVDPPVFEPLPGIPASDIHDAALRLENAATGQQPLYAPVADLDADGCADIVIPLAWLGCGSAPPRPGPSWLDTRPLGLVGPSSDPRLARRGRARLVSVHRWPVGPVAGRRRRARRVADRFVGAVHARRSPTDRDHVGIERLRRAAAHRPDRVPGRARRASAGRPGRVCSCALHRSRRPSQPATASLLTDLPRSSMRTCWTANSAG